MSSESTCRVPDRSVVSIGDLVGGDPGRIRTCDLLFRKQLLYPTELRDQARSVEVQVE